jgi:O-phosphoseryl-tRNA(Cys) synthetase
VARESTNQSATKDRLLVDTLKWAAAKASPSEFGDKQTVEHQGAQEIKVRVVEDEVETPLAVRQAAESVVLGAMQTTVPLLGSGA